VLGVQWLETLGPLEMDYKKLAMSFIEDGLSQTFHGIKPTSITTLTEKELYRLQGVGFFFQIIPTVSNVQKPSYPSDMSSLLAKYSSVFAALTGLPDPRTHDHQIPLQPQIVPVSVLPYRYPYYQKTEIEKMVRELLYRLD
jgi:hypothetical protein